MKLADEVAIITGAGSGIGRAIALEFSKEGADIVIAYSRNDANAQETARMVEALGRKAMVSKTDVSNPGLATFAVVTDTGVSNIVPTFIRGTITIAP